MKDLTTIRETIKRHSSKNSCKYGENEKELIYYHRELVKEKNKIKER
jgi:hypothetical protein